MPLQGTHNNIVEQALKKAILHRKNALFYKTCHGAHVGDVFMSLIYTCELCEADPFDYLTELKRHADELRAAPQNWMPWNYRQDDRRYGGGLSRCLLMPTQPPLSLTRRQRFYTLAGSTPAAPSLKILHACRKDTKELLRLSAGRAAKRSRYRSACVFSIAILRGSVIHRFCCQHPLDQDSVAAGGLADGGGAV